MFIRSLSIAALVGMVITFYSTSVEAHGGGCRKDSPPGQCCHMDRKAGTYHCH